MVDFKAMDFLPRVLYILLTLIFLFLRILFQGNSKNKNVQKNLSKYLFDVITNLGPCFIKLGQALSTRPDLSKARLVNRINKFTG